MVDSGHGAVTRLTVGRAGILHHARGMVFVLPLAHPVRVDETSETGGDAGPAAARNFSVTAEFQPYVPSPTRMPDASSQSSIAATAQRAAALCLDRKANDVVLLGLSGVTDMTDFFVIASGTSDTHVRAVAEHVMQELKKEGYPVHHVEGLSQGRWVLLDYVDFVVHLFHPTLRQFYQLERLWGDAEVIAVDEQGALP